MKYLLSTGKGTEDVITYIKDLILINMKLLPQEIPYWTGGSDELIQDVLEINLRQHIIEVVNKIISRISEKVKGIPLSLDSVEIDGNLVNVNISISGIIETYGIKRYHKQGAN